MPTSLTLTPPALSERGFESLCEWAEQEELPRFRAAQLWHALNSGVQDFDELTEFPRALRARLVGRERLRTLEPVVHLVSPNDGAEKALFRLAGGSTVEAVLIPGRNAGGKRRNTVCVSSQVGCPAGCSFCATGLSGFTRNLTAAEIVDQAMFFAAFTRRRGERVSNIVFMGMGEPLLNIGAVRTAIGRLTDPAGFGIGERSITVSTVGIVPQMRRFASWSGQVNLAVSLHAPNDVLRSSLVPYNEHFPIADLLDAAAEYVRASRRRVSFEYVLLRGVNDAPDLAAELATLLRPLGVLAHVNLIPWNPFIEGKFVRSEGPDSGAFAAALRRNGVNATIRYSKGLDISAACGQLREQVEDALRQTTPAS